MSALDSNKHAYLIMAHHNFTQLQQLITLLDHPRNDIYLHIDKKAAGFTPGSMKTVHSTLVMVDRIRVNWGGHSQIKCEINLLKAAVPKHYQYYHLLSGVDLPLKTQNEIHLFFDQNSGNNYVKFDGTANKSKNFLPRICYFHFLGDMVGNNPGIINAVLRRLEGRSLLLQQKLRVQRKQYVPAYKGTNWFSINDDLAQYVLSCEDIIKKQFY